MQLTELKRVFEPQHTVQRAGNRMPDVLLVASLLTSGGISVAVATLDLFWVGNSDV